MKHAAIGWRGLWLLLMLLAVPAVAQVRASLSQSSIEAGETVTLNIELENVRATPELAPLEADFRVLRMDSGRQVEIRGGRFHTRQRFAVELRPRRSGRIEIPALKVGTQSTRPLRLQVADVAQAGSHQPQAGQAVFLETDISDGSPYVQQAVLLTLRLHYAVNLFSGELQQPMPANASLVPFGSDSRSQRVIDGREYRVLARHYLLIPERSGELVLPAAWFRGEGERIGTGGWFGQGRVQVQASAPAQRLAVRPIPANAAAPWLPARKLSLRVLDVAQQGQLGQGMALKLALHADGATASQLPPLELEPHPQLQVFAEPVERSEGVYQGRIESTISRQFTLLPLAEGELLVQVKPISWWDVSAQRMHRAELAPIRLNIAAGSLQPPPAPLIGQARPEAQARPSKTPAAWRGWLGWGLVLALLILLVCGLVRPGPLGACSKSFGQWRKQRIAQRQMRRALQHALQSGDLPAIAQCLPAVASPAAPSLSALRARLACQAQREAIDLLQQALWGGGDVEAARKQLRAAFADVRVLRQPGKQRAPLLPPLYPER
ncbi:MAG: BatD family protein [Pseudomonadota bacterium]|nr:BatD family protein [Pseudomonadota bacterium]